MTIELNLPFIFHPQEHLVCAGQPDAEHFRLAAEQGLKAVVNLRPDAEMSFDEAALMQELGLEYLQIPVAGPGDLNAENAAELLRFLRARSDQHVMVHCASSNRVGALLALGHHLEGMGKDEALEIGRAAGLTKMEAPVSAIMDRLGGA